MDPKSKMHYYLDWLPLLATAGLGALQMLIALSPMLIHLLSEAMEWIASGLAAN